MWSEYGLQPGPRAGRLTGGREPFLPGVPGEIVIDGGRIDRAPLGLKPLVYVPVLADLARGGREQTAGAGASWPARWAQERADDGCATGFGNWRLILKA